MNRNHFFMIGMVVLFLGIQIHLVESFVLNEKSTQFLAKRLKKADPAPAIATNVFLAATGPSPTLKKSIDPPRWLGWLGMSMGAVLILHSFGMSKPN